MRGEASLGRDLASPCPSRRRRVSSTSTGTRRASQRAFTNGRARRSAEYYTSTFVNPQPGSGNRGLLAGVTLKRFDEDYGEIFDRPPCADGEGPYRFILSPDCGLGQTIDWPAELTAALERAGNGSDTTQVTYEYSVLGLPSARVEDGRRWTFVRDPSGRVLETTTPEGITTTSAPGRSTACPPGSTCAISRPDRARRSFLAACARHSAGTVTRCGSAAN